MIDVGAFIHAERIAQGLNMAQLGRKAGYNKATIKMLEDGNRIGNFETLSNILEALGYEFEVKKRGQQDN